MRGKQLMQLCCLAFVSFIFFTYLVHGYTEEFEAAKKLYDQKDYKGAIVPLEKHCTTYPKDNNGGYMLAQCYMKTKQYSKAIERLDIVLQHHPEDYKAQFLQGFLCLQTKKLDKALTHLKQAAELKPDVAQHQMVYGSALLQAKKTDEAVAVLKKAVDLEPTDPSINLEYGRALIFSGKNSEAVHPLEIASKSSKTKNTALTYLGTAYLSLKQADKAVSTLQQATQADPTEAKNFYYLGQALELKMGDTGQSIESYQPIIQAYEKASDLDKDNAEYYFRHGFACESAAASVYEQSVQDEAVGQKALELLDKAKRAYQSALKIDPSHAAKDRISAVDARIEAIKNPQVIEQEVDE
ncbi:tetratricopeptide repeat protein [bacterium]|nr:tetratricopeptide repeat protein [candidate division CSSED10-310 bacterium]